MTNITCEILDHGAVKCNGTLYEPRIILTYLDKLFWIYLGIYVALVIIAGIMSGLTMGLLSLDSTSLAVLSTGGKPKEQKYAKKILPLVNRHHLLLVTLLLANAVAVESMPLFLDKISDPVTAIVVSVTAVLLFGEVVPQALFTRFGLAIGATLSPLVYFLIFITCPVSWPLSKLLDCVLGKDHATFFRRAELSVLVDIHKAKDDENEDPLTADEALIIQGALTMRDKTVKEVCTPGDSIYALNIDGIMDRETMDNLLSKGHSRVPICEGSKTNLIGLILVKNLIKIDPDDNLPIRQIYKTHGRPLLKIFSNVNLFDALNVFQTGKSHMFAVVEHEDHTESIEPTLLMQGDSITGVVTLEDVIEELIQEEIVDETDVYVDVHKKIKVAKARAAVRANRLSQSRLGTKNSPRTRQESNDEIDYIDDTAPLLP